MAKTPGSDIGLALEGWFDVWVKEPNKRTVPFGKAKNSPTTEGLGDILSVYFGAGSQSLNWYCGVISNSGYAALSTSDTLASHAGWSENTGYSETTRVSIGTPTISNGILLSASMVFTFAAQTVLRGFFLANNNSKGGATGKLWNTALFSSARTVAAGAPLTVVYKLRASGGSTS